MTHEGHMPPGKIRGIVCLRPVCHSIRLRVITVKRPAAGIKIRYCRCPQCGSHYKTREVLVMPSAAKT